MSTLGSQMVSRLNAGVVHIVTDPSYAAERWVNDMFNLGYIQDIVAVSGPGAYTLSITMRPGDEQWLKDGLAKAERGVLVGAPPPSMSMSVNYASIRRGGVNVAVPVWPEHKVGFDVPMTPEGKLDRAELPRLIGAYRRRNRFVFCESTDHFAESQDAFSIANASKVREGDVEFIIYTYDPTESALKFRTMTMSGYTTILTALAEATKQMEDMADRGVMREAVAWEVLKDAKDLPSSFSATEKRVREIMGMHGKVDNTGVCGVLDFPLMRRMQAMPDKAPLKEVRMPFEAHMPAHKKASADDCMAAVRAACANGAHDPNKKFN